MSYSKAIQECLRYIGIVPLKNVFFFKFLNIFKKFFSLYYLFLNDLPRLLVFFLYVTVYHTLAEGKRPLWRPRYRWVDNISMDFQEVGCGYMDWIGLPRIETGGGRL